MVIFFCLFFIKVYSVEQTRRLTALYKFTQLQNQISVFVLKVNAFKAPEKV